MKDWNKPLVMVLGGSTISLLILVATLGATIPTKEIVSRMIAQETPYVQDRSLILYRLKQIEKKLDKLLESDK